MESEVYVVSFEHGFVVGPTCIWPQLCRLTRRDRPEDIINGVIETTVSLLAISNLMTKLHESSLLNEFIKV